MPTRPPIHQPHGVARTKASNHQAGSPSARGYDHAWRKLRLLKLAADPLCWWCLQEDRLVAAEVVDHIQSIVDRPELRMVMSNLRSGCASCHNAHTARSTAAGQRGMQARSHR